MAEMLELANQEFFKTIISMLWFLMEKVRNMQEKMDNMNREMEILRKYEKKWDIEKCNRNENNCDGLISSLYVTVERIWAWRDDNRHFQTGGGANGEVVKSYPWTEQLQETSGVHLSHFSSAME